MKKALAILTTYYRRIAESPLVKFIASFGKGGHRTSSSESRTLNEKATSPSAPLDALNSATEEDGGLAHLVGQNEKSDSGKEQYPTSNPNAAISPTPSAVPSRVAFEQRPANPGSAPAVAIPTVFKTHQFQNAGSASSKSSTMDESEENSALRVPSSTFAPDIVTRAELRRELDSLRRFIESRK